jgi:four helix bundle protein
VKKLFTAEAQRLAISYQLSAFCESGQLADELDILADALRSPPSPPEGLLKDFRQLKAWDKAHQLTLEIYRASARFPREETYGLTSQIRRASASICANLAEGCGRSGDKELARFCSIGCGSASELEYHLLLARDLQFLQAPIYEKLATDTIEIKRMLTALIQKLRAES